jgi:hypothetical protein
MLSEGRVPACRDEDESKDPEYVSFFIAELVSSLDAAS